MMMEAMEDIDEGVMVGGKLLKDVRFADDQGMVADSEDGLQKLMDGLVKTATSYDMKINVKKTSHEGIAFDSLLPHILLNRVTTPFALSILALMSFELSLSHVRTLPRY